MTPSPTRRRRLTNPSEAPAMTTTRRPLRLALSLVLLAAAALIAGPAAADAPALLPLSGWLADADGAGIDGDVDLTITLHDAETGGAEVYSDTVTITVDAGFFTAYAGSGDEALDLALFADHDALWVGLAVDGGEEMSPRLQVATTPWAAWADYAGIADDAAALGGVAAEDYQLAADDADVLGGLTCADGQVAVYDDGVDLWGCGDFPAEADPTFAASDAAGISAAQIGNWDTAHGWGDHGAAGYLTSESDPAFTTSAAAGIAAGDVTNWNTAYGWGDHGTAGYLTSESDPVFDASTAADIDDTDVTNWDTAHGWGDHGTAGYLGATDAANTYIPLAGADYTGDLVGVQSAGVGFDDADVDGSVEFGIRAVGEDLEIHEPEELHRYALIQDNNDMLFYPGGEGSPTGANAEVVFDNDGSVRVAAQVESGCPADFTEIGGWCIEDLPGNTPRGPSVWSTAAQTCNNLGLTLCPVYPLMYCDNFEPSGSTCNAALDTGSVDLWTADVGFSGTETSDNVFDSIVTYNGSNIMDIEPTTNSNHYLCCMAPIYNP